MTLMCFIQNILLVLFYSLMPSLIFTSLVPLSHIQPGPYSVSHFELLSLSSCHRGKQNTVAMEIAHREERQLMRLPVWRQKPIYGHFLSACWEVGLTFYEHCVSLSCVEKLWRQMT